MRIAITIVCTVFAGAVLLVSVPVEGHHSFAAAFDEDKPINLEGVVTNVELVNPHSWIWIDVTNEDGTVTNWGLEGGPPLNLFRNGVTKDTLPVGPRSGCLRIRPRAEKTKVSGSSSSIWMGERCSWAVPPPAPMVIPSLVALLRVRVSSGKGPAASGA